MEIVEPSSDDNEQSPEQALQAWCDNIAVLSADALVDGGVIRKDDLERAAEIISEEIWVRLLVNDYPPGSGLSTASAE